MGLDWFRMGLWVLSVVSLWRHHVQNWRVGSPANCQWDELVRLCTGCGVLTCCGTKTYMPAGQKGKLKGPGRVLVPERERCAWIWLSLRGDLWDTGIWLAGARVGPVCPTKYMDGVCLVTSLLWAGCRIQ